MSANYKTLSDYEVATAEEAQSYFMDQAVIKVDAEVDLSTLPTTVKTAYVLNTGTLWMRNIVNAWVPNVGGATVSETAPANPQPGQLWVKPSEVMPLPVRGYLISGPQSVTATAYTNLSVASKTITTPKPVMCMVNVKGQLSGVAATEVVARLAWTGATTGNSLDLIGSYMGAMSSFVALGRDSVGFGVVMNTGTTTFGVEALRANTSNSVSVVAVVISVTPVAWADEYAVGVS